MRSVFTKLSAVSKRDGGRNHSNGVLSVVARKEQ